MNKNSYIPCVCQQGRTHSNVAFKEISFHHIVRYQSDVSYDGKALTCVTVTFGSNRDYSVTTSDQARIGFLVPGLYPQKTLPCPLLTKFTLVQATYDKRRKSLYRRDFGYFGRTAENIQTAFMYFVEGHENLKHTGCIEIIENSMTVVAYTAMENLKILAVVIQTRVVVPKQVRPRRRIT